MEQGPIRVSILTNIPVPYRLPVYELLDSRCVDLTVFYTAERERNRHWVLPSTSVKSVTLRSVVIEVGGRYVHFTSGVWRGLRRSRPEVVVTTGFNPPQLLAIAWCLVHRVPHVVQTDGTVESEARLSAAHRIIRRLTARHSAAFVAASASGLRLLQTWGASAARTHRSPLAVDNARFAGSGDEVRDIDLLFSGQLTDVKNPLFALDVARESSRRLGRRLSLAVVGTGEQEERLRAAVRSATEEVELHLAGFQQQDALPAWYRRARVFLFPTRWDPWGLVGNEAAAAGTPQVVSPAAGSGIELVAQGGGGYVEPLELERWVQRVVELLTDDAIWCERSAAAREAVAGFTFAAAAEGLRRAVRQAAGR